MSEQKTILIVDDEESIHKALTRTFRREPYDLLHAYDAAEAWGILSKDNDIAAIVCDHYMPGTHGLDLLMDLRERYPDLITILLTAQADLQLVMSAINDGRIHRFYTKPWNSEEIREEIRNLLGGGGSDADARERAARTEARIQEELLPPRDDSGAFILDEADL